MPLVTKIMDVRYLILILSILLCPAMLAAEIVPQEARSCLENIDFAFYSPQGTHDMSLSTLTQTYECGQIHELTTIELFNALVLLMIARDIRLRIPGKTLRKVAATYSIGARRVQTLLPTQYVSQVLFGASYQGSPHMEVYTISSPPLYTERVNFIGTVTTQMATHYGFRVVVENQFRDAFGIMAVNRGRVRQAQKIVMYEQGKIAIYVRGLFRPKRWLLSKIERIE